MKKLFTLLLVLLPLLLTNCTGGPIIVEGYDQISVFKGNHQFNPGNRGIGKKERMYSWYFTDDTKYILDSTAQVLFSGDQKDWNKLIGMSYSLISNHINSAMVGWRYNPDQELFELNAYYHINEARFFTAPLAYVEANELFQTRIEKFEPGELEGWDEHPVVRVRIKTESGQHVEYVAEFQRQNLPDLTRKIATWFGGNNAAPYYLKMYRKEIEVW